ncbi:MAG: TetR/AcrR family transcriptional regulator [Myxococcota bacterium]|nr:TetR/AcrR family transcriptional regulator [Myxococcota bacterium]
MSSPPQSAAEDEVSARIHAAAEGLLEERGIDGIQVREVAERAETSTMGVYSRFGGKAGLLDSLYRSGFRRLRAACEPLRGVGSPNEELDAMADAYRETAIAWPHHYDLMFGRGVPGFEPSPASAAEALTGFGVWVDSVKRAAAAGVLAGHPEENAFRLWALTHGIVSLELSGMAPPASDRARRRRHREASRAFVAGLGG